MSKPIEDTFREQEERVKVERFNQRVLDEGAEAVDNSPGIKIYTVISVRSEDGDRYADHVEAENWLEAMQKVQAERGDEVLIAGVLVGSHFCVDEQ